MRLKIAHGPQRGSEITSAHHPFSIHLSLSQDTEKQQGTVSLVEVEGRQGPRETLTQMGKNWPEEETAMVSW